MVPATRGEPAGGEGLPLLLTAGNDAKGCATIHGIAGSRAGQNQVTRVGGLGGPSWAPAPGELLLGDAVAWAR